MYVDHILVGGSTISSSSSTLLLFLLPEEAGGNVDEEDDVEHEASKGVVSEVDVLPVAELLMSATDVLFKADTSPTDVLLRSLSK